MYLGQYDADAAARDTILLQTKDKQLQQKILTEDLNYANTVKYGLSLEQGKKKVDEIIASRGRMGGQLGSTAGGGG